MYTENLHMIVAHIIFYWDFLYIIVHDGILWGWLHRNYIIINLYGLLLNIVFVDSHMDVFTFVWFNLSNLSKKKEIVKFSSPLIKAKNFLIGVQKRAPKIQNLTLSEAYMHRFQPKVVTLSYQQRSVTNKIYSRIQPTLVPYFPSVFHIAPLSGPTLSALSFQIPLSSAAQRTPLPPTHLLSKPHSPAHRNKKLFSVLINDNKQQQ